MHEIWVFPTKKSFDLICVLVEFRLIFCISSRDIFLVSLMGFFQE